MIRSATSDEIPTMSTLFRPGEFYGVPQFGSHGAGFDVRASAAQPRLGVRDIAAEFNVHPVHLARAFRATWGCSPGELIRWRRVDRAAELLRSMELPAAHIAAETGFVDQSHMTRAFRAVYGTTPAAYRRERVSPIQASADVDRLECGSP